MPSSWQLCTIFIVLLILYRVHSLEIIEAHLIPHSHCDPGWLQTYEGYYHSKVSHILTNVVAELLKNSSRTFVWSEVSFFSLWYDSQPEEVRANTRKLIENKQFEFVGGGWVQHDEANAHYHQVVDQLTVGHRYLWENFKVKPNMAWQIDPFGHSSLTPTALALAGFDAVVLNRVHYATKKELTRNQHLEFLWHSHTRPELKVLAHVLKGSYMSTYDFENSDLPDKMEVEGPSFATKYIRSRAEYYRTNVVMIPWGNDFRFVKAERQYSRMDPLIDYVNAHPELGVRVQYSTLSRYFAAVHRAGAEFPSYAGDFFPYADTERAYWTGYYTTQPSLKLYSRQVDAVIRAADIALTLANHHAAIPEVTGQIIFDIVSNSAAMTLARQEAALILHHDAITGTAKSAVLNDYMRRLNSAYYAAKDVLSDALSVLLTGHEGSPRLDSEISVLDFNYKKVPLIRQDYQLIPY
jgi:alpha-mannosidase II